VRLLRDGNHAAPESTAAVLVRTGAALTAFDGSPRQLAADALDLADLGGRLVRLAPGFGSATALRFLRPLRGILRAAAETPLDRPSRAAAIHLGWSNEGEDEEGAPGSLAAELQRQDDAPDLADVEAALSRLGARACLRGRVRACPLGDACPARQTPDDRPQAR